MDGTPHGEAITRAMDYGTNTDVQDAICAYIESIAVVGIPAEVLCNEVKKHFWL